MEHDKLLLVLEANIEKYWREWLIGDFDQLLVELEKGGQITVDERESLLVRLWRKQLGHEAGQGADARP